MPVTNKEWADAFARQARSDMAVCELLLPINKLERCHKLHYLQMACEKIAKAYRLRDMGMTIEETESSHKAFSKFIEGHFKSPSVKRQYAGRKELLRNTERFARSLAEDIEKLAPAIDREATPQNAEYPWEDSGKIICPCDHDFSRLSRLDTPEGENFLDIVKVDFLDY